MTGQDFLQSRQTKFTAYVTVYIVIVIAVLGLLNFLAQRYNKSVDTTSNKRFTLSDQTKKVVGNLQQDTKITYVDKTSNFPAGKDLLDRYNNLSNKLTIDYVDPDKKPQIAKALGVRAYGNIFVDVGQKHQEAKALTEEEVTGALIRAVKGGERTLCAVTGSGEHLLDDAEGRSGYGALKQSVEKNNFRTRSISLLQKAEVPADCTVLLIAGPRTDYVEPVVNAVKTFVEGGGHALFFLDPPVKLGRDEVAANDALGKVIDGWGVTLNKDLVLDTSGVGQIFGFNEAVPLVTNYERQTIVTGLKGMATAFPLIRSIDVKAAPKAQVEKLFSSGDNSYATTNIASGTISIDPARDKKGPLVLAVAGSLSGAKQGRFVIVGSSSWTANNIFTFNGNRDLFLNMLSWLSSDEDLIAIRPKDPEDRRITLTKSQMNGIFYTSIILLPLAAIIAGVGVWWRRR